MLQWYVQGDMHENSILFIGLGQTWRVTEVSGLTKITLMLSAHQCVSKRPCVVQEAVKKTIYWPLMCGNRPLPCHEATRGFSIFFINVYKCICEWCILIAALCQLRGLPFCKRFLSIYDNELQYRICWVSMSINGLSIYSKGDDIALNGRRGPINLFGELTYWGQVTHKYLCK